MKLSNAISAVSVVALLAFSGAALAAEATTNDQGSQDIKLDATGKIALGVDISGAGNTPDSVKAYVAGLSADQQTGITNGCKEVQASAATSNADVLTFCNNLLGPSSGAAMTGPAQPGDVTDQPADTASTTGTNDGGNDKDPNTNN
jgi:hypothetical protein